LKQGGWRGWFLPEKSGHSTAAKSTSPPSPAETFRRRWASIGRHPRSNRPPRPTPTRRREGSLGNRQPLLLVRLRSTTGPRPFHNHRQPGGLFACSRPPEPVIPVARASVIQPCFHRILSPLVSAHGPRVTSVQKARGSPRTERGE